MILAAILSSALVSVEPAEDLDTIKSEVNRLVLAGASIPPDFLLRVQRLDDPADRMDAVVYLRRSGLMTGPAVSLDRYVLDTPAFKDPSGSEEKLVADEAGR
ncbi:hypothetical protein [Paracoccus sp. SCSIO 75233]|uniref:hypothetical protein n=1 Tax=Paracoccus sp. SCSIO 75233 TaxID=3017782 RepID=UPI0022F04CCC|nr:hypothetical protein [Paracoccus sp. SCSIO 75233]WBU53136.1 hypothetical protein PAF12_15165 [Paracoccus sp. SCSIO 75233]